MIRLEPRLYFWWRYQKIITFTWKILRILNIDVIAQKTDLSNSNTLCYFFKKPYVAADSCEKQKKLIFIEEDTLSQRSIEYEVKVMKRSCDIKPQNLLKNVKLGKGQYGLVWPTSPVIHTKP